MKQVLDSFEVVFLIALGILSTGLIVLTYWGAGNDWCSGTGTGGNGSAIICGTLGGFFAVGFVTANIAILCGMEYFSPIEEFRDYCDLLF